MSKFYSMQVSIINPVRNKIRAIMMLALLAAGLVFCGTAAAGFVPANSPRIKTMGRWIPTDNGSLNAGRGAVIASAEFEGTGVWAQMYSDSQRDVWWLKKLDDGPFERFKSHMGTNVLYQNLPPGKHQLTIIRETEGMQGVTILRGFFFVGEKGSVDLTSAATPTSGNPERKDAVGPGIVSGNTDGKEPALWKEPFL